MALQPEFVVNAVGCAAYFDAVGAADGVGAAVAKLAMLCSDDWLK